MGVSRTVMLWRNKKINADKIPSRSFWGRFFCSLGTIAENCKFGTLVSNFKTQNAKSEKCVSNFDTQIAKFGKWVSKFDRKSLIRSKEFDFSQSFEHFTVGKIALQIITGRFFLASWLNLVVIFWFCFAQSHFSKFWLFQPSSGFPPTTGFPTPLEGMGGIWHRNFNHSYSSPLPSYTHIHTHTHTHTHTTYTHTHTHTPRAHHTCGLGLTLAGPRWIPPSGTSTSNLYVVSSKGSIVKHSRPILPEAFSSVIWLWRLPGQNNNKQDKQNVEQKRNEPKKRGRKVRKFAFVCCVSRILLPAKCRVRA